MDIAEAVLSPYHKRAAVTLFGNVLRLSDVAGGVKYLAFITLTFQKDVRDHLEASKCYKSFNSNWFSKNTDYGLYINTKELQESRGVWHYHLIVQVYEDILTGFDFSAFHEWLKGNNRFKSPCPTGSPHFIRLWQELGEAVVKYGFGKITAIEPIQSNQEAVARYIGGYIGKTVSRRTDQEKGVKLVVYPQGWLRNSPKFSWNTKNGAEWRRKLGLFAKLHGCTEMWQLTDKLGKNWAYKNAHEIFNIDQILMEHKVDEWQYLPDETRISRQTGEIQSKEEWQYKAVVMEVWQRNKEQKRQLLREQAMGIAKIDTFTKGEKHKKRMSKTQKAIEEAKRDYLEYRRWLKRLPDAPF